MPIRRGKASLEASWDKVARDRPWSYREKSPCGIALMLLVPAASVKPSVMAASSHCLSRCIVLLSFLFHSHQISAVGNPVRRN